MYSERSVGKWLLVIGLIAMMSGYAVAAEQGGQSRQEGTTQPGQPTTPGQMTTRQTPGMSQTMNLVRTSNLIGKTLKDAQGGDLGIIHDIVLTDDHQQVSYVALSEGTVWHADNKLVAIPWQALNVQADGTATANIDKQMLQRAPGFKEDNWPSQASRLWLSAGMTRSTYGQQTQTTRRPATSFGDRAQSRDRLDDPNRSRIRDRLEDPNRGQIRDRLRDLTASDEDTETSAMSSAAVQNRRVSKLIGLDVKNAENEDIANVEDFVVDAREGRLAYAIVSFGGFWGIGEKYVAVPSAAIELEPRRNMARLDADQKTLESLAFEPGSFPNLSDQSYAQKLHEAFGEEPYWTVYGFASPEQQRAAAASAWAPNSEYNKSFKADQVKTVTGTVETIGTFQPAAGVQDGVRLRVKTDDGKFITVHAGPLWYFRQHDFYLKPGDKVSVTGSDTKIGWRSALIATQIQSDGKTLELRSETGEPKWDVQQMQSMRSTQPSTRRFGEQPADVGSSRQRQQQGSQTRQQRPSQQP